MTDKKITKIIIFFIAVEFILFSPASLWAEENLFGNGYRGRLDRISSGRSPDVFMSLDIGLKKDVEIKNQKEKLVNSSKQANADLEISIQNDNQEKMQRSQALQNEVTEARERSRDFADVNGEGRYVPDGNGTKTRFTNGLATTILNEPVTDEFGNVSRKDTRKMKYNDKRLLTSYDATLTDEFEVTTKIIFDGAEYSPDSVFYGNHTTRANKNLIKYHAREIDAGGNISDRYWQGKFGSKFATTSTQNVLNPVYGNSSFQRTNIRYENNDPERMASYHEEGTGQDGLFYTLDRTNITYNSKGNVMSYYEVKTVTQLDGSKIKVTTAAQFEYLEAEDGDRILKSTITTTTENPDGSQRVEPDTTTYNYDANKKLIGGLGSNQFTGQEAKWWQYTDTQEHTLSRNVDKDARVSYSYIDPDTLKTIIVPENQVTATLKDGNLFSGNSEIQYEILHGKPIAKQVPSITSYYNPEDNNLFKIEKSTVTYNNGLVNNLPRVLESNEQSQTWLPNLDPNKEHLTTKDTTTLYIYDSKGNLIDAKGWGTASGWEYSDERGFYNPYESEIKVRYVVILGKALQKEIIEDKTYLTGKEEE